MNPIEESNYTSKKRLLDTFNIPSSKEQLQLEAACVLTEFEFQNSKFTLGCFFLQNTKFKQDSIKIDSLIQSYKYWVWWNFEFESFIIRQNELMTPWDNSLWQSIIPTIIQSPLIKSKFLKHFK